MATCALVAGNQRAECAGEGTVVIHAIPFAPDGDLDTVSADFRLDCSVYGVMSGSVRYGSDRPIPALDQSTGIVYPGTLLVGETGAAQAVTVTNIGTQAMTLGVAALSGEYREYDIAQDGCSGARLEVNQSCTLEVTFSPPTTDIDMPF